MPDESSPDVFGYAGDVVFPSIALSQINEAVDTGLIFQPNDSADNRHEQFVNCLTESFTQRHNAPKEAIHILHAARISTERPAKFKLWHSSFSNDGVFKDEIINIDHSKSALVLALGTGADSMLVQNINWIASASGGSSRAIFSALCDSIRSGSDLLSGGAPQLVGIYPKQLPQAFGIKFDGNLYLNGLRLTSMSNVKNVEWRDSLFQRIDPKTKGLLDGAQRHWRPGLPKFRG